MRIEDERIVRASCEIVWHFEYFKLHQLFISCSFPKCFRSFYFFSFSLVNLNLIVAKCCNVTASIEGGWKLMFWVGAHRQILIGEFDRSVAVRVSCSRFIFGIILSVCMCVHKDIWIPGVRRWFWFSPLASTRRIGCLRTSLGQRSQLSELFQEESTPAYPEGPNIHAFLWITIVLKTTNQDASWGPLSLCRVLQPM